VGFGRDPITHFETGCILPQLLNRTSPFMTRDEGITRRPEAFKLDPFNDSRIASADGYCTNPYQGLMGARFWRIHFTNFKFAWRCEHKGLHFLGNPSHVTFLLF
jgi:hypothetical protein